MMRQGNISAPLGCIAQKACLKKAMAVVHPFDSLCPLKDELLKMLFNIVTKLKGLFGLSNRDSQH